MPKPFSFGIALVEKVGRGLWGVVTAIVANIEDLGWNAEPSQVANNCKG